MRILLASTLVPFVDGGYRTIIRGLAAALGRAGHDVDVVWLPFCSDWTTLPEQMLALRLTDITDAADLLIATRPPAYLLRHPNKVLWFIHHLRGAYDLWGTPLGDIPDTPDGRQIRESIMSADKQAFAEARHIFANSRVVSDRLRRFNGVEAEVLYPPLWEPERFRAGPYGDYVFCPSRLTGHKRQWLAISALRHVRSDVRLIIAGAPDQPSELVRLQAAIAEPGVAGRVQLIPRWISEDEKIELLAGALGVLYVPFDEDSYGYASLEAFSAHKPVITCRDSGGTLELIEDGRNGLVVAPEPEAVAAAMDRLFEQHGLAARLGLAAAARTDELGISWDRVVSAMTS